MVCICALLGCMQRVQASVNIRWVPLLLLQHKQQHPQRPCCSVTSSDAELVALVADLCMVCYPATGLELGTAGSLEVMAWFRQGVQAERLGLSRTYLILQHHYSDA